MDISRIEGLTEILRIEQIEDYPQIEAVLFPAAESAVAEAVGNAWIEENKYDPAVVQVICAMVATWLQKPEMTGEITPGMLFLIGQLKARALGGQETG